MKKLISILTLAVVVSACSNNAVIDEEILVDGESGEVAGVQIENEDEIEEEVPVEVEEAAPIEEEVEVEAFVEAPVIIENAENELPANNEIEVNLYTETTVSNHGTKDDCWTIINDKVYDLSSWLAPQPDDVYNLETICGTDGTLSFGGSYLAGVRADAQFVNYYLGDL